MSRKDRDRDREFEKARRGYQPSRPPAEFMPLSRVAGLLGVCTRTLRRMIQRKQFPEPVPLGRRKVVPRAVYDDFANRLARRSCGWEGSDDDAAGENL